MQVTKPQKAPLPLISLVSQPHSVAGAAVEQVIKAVAFEECTAVVSCGDHSSVVFCQELS